MRLYFQIICSFLIAKYIPSKIFAVGLEGLPSELELSYGTVVPKAGVTIIVVGR